MSPPSSGLNSKPCNNCEGKNEGGDDNLEVEAEPEAQPAQEGTNANNSRANTATLESHDGSKSAATSSTRAASKTSRASSTASRKTQTSQDLIDLDVEKIKAKIKSGEDIEAHEVLQTGLLIMDSMRRDIAKLRNAEGKTSQVEVNAAQEDVGKVEQEGEDANKVEQPVSADPDEAESKHTLMNINVSKSLKQNLGSLKMIF